MKDLRQAIQDAIHEYGFEILQEPKRLVGLVLDAAELETAASAALESACDEGFFAKFADLLQEDAASHVDDAVARAVDYLSDEHAIDSAVAKQIAAGIAEGIVASVEEATSAEATNDDAASEDEAPAKAEEAAEPADDVDEKVEAAVKNVAEEAEADEKAAEEAVAGESEAEEDAAAVVSCWAALALRVPTSPARPPSARPSSTRPTPPTPTTARPPTSRSARSSSRTAPSRAPLTPRVATTSLPSAEYAMTAARNAILNAEIESRGIEVSDEDVAAYAEKALGTSDFEAIGSAYGMDAEAVEKLITDNCRINALREQVVGEELPAMPEAPATAEEGKEDEATKKYADYIIALVGEEWDAKAGTWASEDSAYATALDGYGLQQTAPPTTRRRLPTTWPTSSTPSSRPRYPAMPGPST